MELLKVFFTVLIFACISNSIASSEGENEEFLQWCTEELRNFQDTEFVLPDTLPDFLHGLLQTKLENFDLTELCQFVVVSGFNEKISLEEMQKYWTQFRTNFPSFYCKICNEMETKIKTKLIASNSFEDMINELVDNFPDDSRNKLLLEYGNVFTDDLQKLLSESMCHKALPKCSQFNVEADCDGVFCNITHCFLCSLCEAGFMLLNYDLLDSPEVYHSIYNFTHDTICPAFNFTIGTGHPLNGYTFCLTILDDLVMGILSIIKFYLDPYTMCYKETGVCDATVFTNDLLTCMCTGVQWPKRLENLFCSAKVTPICTCAGSSGCP